MKYRIINRDGWYIPQKRVCFLWFSLVHHRYVPGDDCFWEVCRFTGEDGASGAIQERMDQKLEKRRVKPKDVVISEREF